MKDGGYSFIVTCYNLEKYIAECLDSLIGQNFDSNLFEIICVDDGSSDDSAGIIRDREQRGVMLRAFFIANGGLEKACNLGVRQARFDRVIRVDGDDILSPDYLTQMDAAIKEDPGYDFYYCGDYVEFNSMADERPKRLPQFDAEEIFTRGDFFATGTIYKKSQLHEIGYFPEEIKNCGLENYSVILKLLSLGRKGLPVYGASFKYRRHPNNMSVLKREAILDFGKKLLGRYGRQFLTNEYHPYGLKVAS